MTMMMTTTTNELTSTTPVAAHSLPCPIDPPSDDSSCRNFGSGTFGWSDFPCQGDGSSSSSSGGSSGGYYRDNHFDSATSLSLSSLLLSEYIPREVPPPPPLPISDASPPKPPRTLLLLPPPPPSSPTSCCTMIKVEDLDEAETTNPTNDGIWMTTAAASIVDDVLGHHRHHRRRVVHFAPLTRVRVHTVVLGDHPLCAGGMALQLGWAFAPTIYVPLRPIVATTMNHYGWSHDHLIPPSSSPPPTLQPLPNGGRYGRNHRRQCGGGGRGRTMAELRLSYAQRRERLQELTGMAGCQLLQEEYLLVCCSRSNSSSSDFTTTRSAMSRPSSLYYHLEC
jgi:hypothetical protein